MEPHGPHVVGENEALQQFFSGHDVSRVLDSHTAVAVDTSILEQYLSADLSADLSTGLSADLSVNLSATNFILPESPPDSGSEAFSPAQMPERQYEPSLWRQQMFAPVSSSCRFKAPSAPPSELLTHEQLRNMGLTNIHIKPGSPPCAPAQRHLHTPQAAGHSPFLNLRGSAAPTPPPPPFRYTLCSEAGAHLHNAAEDSTTHSGSYSTLCSEAGAHLHNAAEDSTTHSGSYSTLCSEAGAHLHNTAGASTSTAHSGRYNTLCSEAGEHLHNAAEASTSHSGSNSTLCSEPETRLHAVEDSTSHSGSYNALCSEPETRLHAAEDSTSTSTAHSCSPESRKRRRSDFEESSRPKAPCEVGGPGVGGAGGFSGGSYSSLTWNHFSSDQWVALLDGSCQSLSPLAFHVDADKGFTFSSVDEAFVCQKKNHFQVTVQIGVSGEPRYIRTHGGSQEVDHFEIKVFGIKLEDRSHQVLIEQSQSDRSKRPFHPVRVRLPSCKITKVTLGRLHFSETTSNNIRKKGKPNPDQRYFQMVVGLYAAVKEETFLLTALVSERIIVRASNPGQFEADGEPLWQRGQLQDTAVCHGRVGINTDSPDEALVVCGNAKVMGTILQPSDQRAKHNLQEVDSEQQLKRITQMRIVEFDYKPEFAASMGIDQAHQTGVIAQEVKELLPSAVREVGDVTCSDGEKIHNFLMVDKEQIFMENIGAVQQLSKVTNNLETRIEELEVWNQRLAKLKSLTGSLRSHRKSSSACSAPTSAPSRPPKTKKEEKSHKHSPHLQRRIVQAGVFALLAAVAFCIISITAVYLVTLEEDTDTSHEHSNSSLVPPLSTAWSSTVPPTTPPESWPPDVDFCDLLYCDQVYCCPTPPGGSTGINISLSDSWPYQFNLTEKRIQHFYNLLKNAKDWTNTSIQHFRIKENKQIIDSKYCVRDECGPSRFVFRVPISQFVPGNMRITLLMNSTELLVVHLCHFDESAACSTRTDMNTVTGSRYPTNTQGEHEWPLHVARLYHSSYHFRSSVAGQADCSTDRHYAGILFTDYHFHFYRRCLH